VQINVTGRHFEVTPELRAHLDVRLNRMHRYLDRLQSAHVIVSAEKHRYGAEILLRADGHEFASKDIADDVYSALDRVVDKIDVQIRRFKDKRTTKRKNGGRENGVIESKSGTLQVLKADGRGTAEHDVLHTTDYPIEVLSVDDAMLKLEQSGESFLVFTNQATELMHVVYKLPDGNFGVVNLHAAG